MGIIILGVGFLFSHIQHVCGVTTLYILLSMLNVIYMDG